ncbi:hypothetical protein GGR55DRAFT_145525 [Xylaria sp. FL0064]|nr:hypothetical protein GGR55DRAFT_145525 [Xylaria sp. FL0064]
MSDRDPMESSTMTSHTFPQFPSLPAEIRFQIWRLSGRPTVMYHKNDFNKVISFPITWGGNATRINIKQVALVNKEAEREAFYGLEKLKLSEEWTGRPFILVNWDLDLFHIRPRCPLNFPGGAESTKKIKNIAINISMPDWILNPLRPTVHPGIAPIACHKKQTFNWDFARNRRPAEAFESIEWVFLTFWALIRHCPFSRDRHRGLREQQLAPGPVTRDGRSRGFYPHIHKEGDEMPNKCITKRGWCVVGTPECEQYRDVVTVPTNEYGLHCIDTKNYAYSDWNPSVEAECKCMAQNKCQEKQMTFSEWADWTVQQMEDEYIPKLIGRKVECYMGL